MSGRVFVVKCSITTQAFIHILGSGNYMYLFTHTHIYNDLFISHPVKSLFEPIESNHQLNHNLEVLPVRSTLQNIGRY